MSASYPPADHMIEVCAGCHKVRDNPLSIDRCCKSPLLYRYQRTPDFPRVPTPKRRDPERPSHDPRQMEFRDTVPVGPAQQDNGHRDYLGRPLPPKPQAPPTPRFIPEDFEGPRGKVERCGWCDERHGGGPEYCRRDPPPKGTSL